MKILSLVIFFILLQTEVYSFISKFLSLETNSKEYLLIINPDSFSLKEGALLASGMKGSLLQNSLDRISNFEAGFSSAGSLPENPIEVSKLIFNLMHTRLMVKAADQDSTFELLLKKGLYNPLSAAILFNSLMEDQGFSCKCILDGTNVYSILSIEKVDILVNAFDPAGFDIDSSGIDRGPGLTEYAAKKSLLAYIYEDLSERANLSKQYEYSYQYALRSIAIDPDLKNMHTNLAKAITGYSLYLSDTKKEYSEALSVLEEAVLHLPLKNLYLTNYFYILNKYLNVLIESGFCERAVAEMDKYILLAGRNDEYEMDIYTKIFTKVINHDNDFLKAYEIGKKALAEKSRYDNIRVLMINGYNLLSRKLIDDWRKYPEGEELMLKWYRLMKNDYFDTILENYYSQTGMKFNYYGNPDRGMEIISNGLAIFPQSKVLISDMAGIAELTAIYFFRKGNFEKGNDYAQISMQTDPSNESTISNFQYFYYQNIYREMRYRNYNKALEIAEKGLELFPSDTNIINYEELLKKRVK